MYKEKFAKMLNDERNIPFTREEIEEMPMGFTPTSIKSIHPLVIMYNVGRNKHISVSQINARYHQKSLRKSVKEAA